jgi:NAD(P)H-hydrate epimerase
MLPHDMGVIADGATSVLMKELADYDVLLCGPGMGTEKTTREFLLSLLDEETVQKKKAIKRKIGFQTGSDSADSETSDDENETTLPPLVIDADGLNLLAEVDNWSDLLPDNTILTPHPGEMGRLCGMDTSEVQANRIDLAQEKAAEWNCVVVLKGAHTVIAAPDGQAVLLPFKTDALATAGTGDVLAGLIAGFRAQGLNALDSAIAGGYVHGIAGKHAAEAISTRSVLAGDVLKAVGSALVAIDA